MILSHHVCKWQIFSLTRKFVLIRIIIAKLNEMLTKMSPTDFHCRQQHNSGDWARCNKTCKATYPRTSGEQASDYRWNLLA